MVKKETLRLCPVTSSISSSPLLSRSLRAKNVFGLNSSFIQNSCCSWHECYLWQLFLFLPNLLCCVLCQWMFDLQNSEKSYFPRWKDQQGLKTSAMTFLLAWPALTASSLSCSAFLCSSSLIFFIFSLNFSSNFYFTNPPWCAAAAAPPRTASPSRNAGSPSPATPWTSFEFDSIRCKYCTISQNYFTWLLFAIISILRSCPVNRGF